jgi:dTDP-4-amino-4,6-dideoxygalactose transaminase
MMKETQPINGIPTRATFLPFSPPLLGEEEEREVIDTLRSGWITTGPKTQQFEKDLASYLNVPNVLTVSSCTAALHLSMIVLNIGPGDEVITTPYTFASTGHVILYVGAKPVFADISPDTFNINPDNIESLITEKTKAIITMDYGGHPCDIDPILEIAKKHNLKVVVDAAHSIGSTYRNEKVGNKGDIVCYSFYATKNLATGEGGAMTSMDPDLISQARIMAMYGISDARQIWQRYTPKGSWHYDVPYLGFKYNFTDIQASLGIHQLRKLDHFIERRRENAQIYHEILKDCANIRLPFERSYVRSNYHLFPILLNLDSLSIDRGEFIEYLRAENIGVSVLWPPLPNHTLYKEMGFNLENYPQSNYVFQRIINVPVSPIASTDDIRDAATAILKICNHFSK